MIWGTNFEKSASRFASFAHEVVYDFLEISFNRNGQPFSTSLVPVDEVGDPEASEKGRGIRKSERKGPTPSWAGVGVRSGEL